MTDVTNRLSRLGGPTADPTDTTVAADLSRGRAARSRRNRNRAAVAGVGLTLAMGGALGVVAITQSGDPAPPPPIASPSDGGASDNEKIALVGFEGQQPEGFTLAKVPEGYVVQGSDAFVLTLAEPGDDSHPLDFRGKLVVTLESSSAEPGKMEGDGVTIDGNPGALRAASDGLARLLEYHDGTHEVLIQAWKSIGLTDEQLIEFAEGITVTSEAQAPVG